MRRRAGRRGDRARSDLRRDGERRAARGRRAGAGGRASGRLHARPCRRRRCCDIEDSRNRPGARQRARRLHCGDRRRSRDRHGLTVVEDAAEALGSRVRRQPSVPSADAAAFSFAPTKIVTTGQGGVVVTDDLDRAPCPRAQGSGPRDARHRWRRPPSGFGFNFKLTNVQAAIGLVQLDRLDRAPGTPAPPRDWYAEELEALEPTVAPRRRRPRAGRRHDWIDVLCDDRDALAAHLRVEAPIRASSGIRCTPSRRTRQQTERLLRTPPGSRPRALASVGAVADTRERRRPSARPSVSSCTTPRGRGVS